MDRVDNIQERTDNISKEENSKNFFFQMPVIRNNVMELKNVW